MTRDQKGVIKFYKSKIVYTLYANSNVSKSNVYSKTVTNCYNQELHIQDLFHVPAKKQTKTDPPILFSIPIKHLGRKKECSTVRGLLERVIIFRIIKNYSAKTQIIAKLYIRFLGLGLQYCKISSLNSTICIVYTF